MASTIPDSNENDLLKTVQNPKNIKFELEKIQNEQTLKIINGMKNKKSSGFDSFSNSFIKSISLGIYKPLTIIINKSIQSGVFPRNMKIAKIIPLFKAGERENVNNYRPISLLPTLSKVLEKVIYKQVMEHFEENFLTDKQFGFRGKHELSLIHI